jgi:multidrug efflux pump subunit AcrA (membrane-fusion protein)
LLALLLAGGAASLLAARRRRRALGWAVLGVALVASLGASSCSGNPPAPKPQPPQWVGGTPPGTYTITINVVAYSGSPLEFSHTMPLTFTVTAIPGETAASVGSPN